MDLLIIGGSRFLGYHLAALALASGHHVTLFNRGLTNPSAFPEAERVTGDRDKDLELLKGRRWDAVVDTCGYVPRSVRRSAELLAGAVDRYCFISTCSVYAEFPSEGLDEDSPLASLEDPTTEEVTGETYGGLKVLCEQTVQRVYPDKALIVRPGLIVGPRDPTDRFTYWPRRVRRGGEALAPGSPDEDVQFIDGRDLAAFVLHLAVSRQTGVYNAVGPGSRCTWRGLLDACKAATGSAATFTWVDDAFLLAQGVTPWQDLPLWLPANLNGLHRVNKEKSVRAGLTHRPAAETIGDLLVWDATRPASDLRPAPDRPQALGQEREAEILRAWHQRAKP